MRKAFTLIEVIVLLYILGILAALIILALIAVFEGNEEYGQVKEIQPQVLEYDETVVCCPHCGKPINIDIGKGE